MRYLMPLALLFVSCVSVDYMGKSYAPTKEVDLYFSMEEVARALDVSLATVEREWRAARAWLGKRLGAGGGEVIS